LPAPPSSNTAPSTAPSYAQGSGGSMRFGENAWNGGRAGQNNYAGQPNAGGYYSNASYGNGRDLSASGQGATGRSAGAAQGFYSPEYRGGTAAPGGQVYGASPAANTYQGGYVSDGAGAGAAPGTAPRSGSMYGNTPSYGGGTYAQTPSSAPAGYGSSGTNPDAGYGASGGAAAAYGQTPAYPSTGQMGPVAQNPASPGSYRPGSTSRSTQFGTSDNINVPGRESVQPAVYAGGAGASGSQTPSSSAPATYGSDPYSPAPQTATGGYPQTYQR
jgi:hypothetical protein